MSEHNFGDELGERFVAIRDRQEGANLIRQALLLSPEEMIHFLSYLGGWFQGRNDQVAGRVPAKAA